MTREPGSDTEPNHDGALVASGPTSARRRRMLLVVMLLGLVLAVSTFVLLQRRASGAFPNAPELDVPRVEGDHVVFSEKYRERTGIRAEPAKSGRLTPRVAVVGTTALNPEYTSAVGTRLTGQVKRVLKYEGATVRKGDLLAEVESPELAEVQASVIALTAQKHSAKLNADRERDLAARSLSTAREAEAAEAKLNEYAALLRAAQQRTAALGGNSKRFGVHELLAPIAGTVLERNVAPGQSVIDHLTAFRIANLDYLWVELRVFERSVRSIREGDAVELQPFSNTSETISGRVAHVGSLIDPATRSADVRVEVDNRARKLRAGEAVKAMIHASGDAHDDATLVPAKAITYIDGKAAVFIADSPLSVRRANVELGDSDGKQQQVLSGIAAGEQVVVSGVFDLKSELFR